MDAVWKRDRWGVEVSCVGGVMWATEMVVESVRGG